jgi:hypothetical protein
VGEAIYGIEDPMSSATDLAKSMDPIVPISMYRYFSEHTVVINIGNIFAKKINLGDNCFSFDEFLNKYRDFVYGMEDLGTKLMPTEKVKFFEHVFLLKNIEVF